MTETQSKTPAPWGVLAIVAGCIFALALIFDHDSGRRPSVGYHTTAAPAPEAPAPISREAFRSVCRPVMPASQCSIALGPPSRTQQGTGYEYWYYEARTFDKLTGRRDAAVQLVLKDDLVPSATKRGSYEPGKVVTAVNFY